MPGHGWLRFVDVMNSQYSKRVLSVGIETQVNPYDEVQCTLHRVARRRASRVHSKKRIHRISHEMTFSLGY